MQGLTQVRPVDPVLTQFGLEYRQDQSAYVADAVFPYVQTAGDTGTYYIADPLNNLRNDNPAWAFNAGASRVDMRFTSDAFKAQKYGFETPVTDDDVRNWLAGGQALRERATAMLTDKLLLARDVRTATTLEAISANDTITATQWDGSSANPRNTITKGQAGLRKRIGRAGNTLIVAGPVWDAITGTQASGTAGAIIIDAIKYTMQAMGSSLTPQLMASYFNLDYVVPALAVQSDTTKFETATVAGTAGLPQAGSYVLSQDRVYLMYTERNPAPQTVAYGLTFGPDLLTIDTYREERIQADIVRASSIITEKVTCTSAVWSVYDVLA